MGRLSVVESGRSGWLRRRCSFWDIRRGTSRRLCVPWVAGTMLPPVAWALVGCGSAVAGPALGSAPTTAAAAALGSASTKTAAPAVGSAGTAAVTPALRSAGTATAVRTLLTRAGNGWALAMYATGRDVSHSRVTLYLTSTGGARYAVHTWKYGTQLQLAAWSPDRSMAIFQAVSPTGGLTVVHQMTLTSGATTSFLLPAFSRVIGYAQPDGASVFVAEDSGIYRYSLTGTQLARLSAVSGQANDLGSGGAVMFRGGREIVVPASPAFRSSARPASCFARCWCRTPGARACPSAGTRPAFSWRRARRR